MMKSTTNHKNRRLRLLKILIGFIVFLLILRLALPYIVLRYVNNKLTTLEEYYGHVDDIDIALIRGAYVINNIIIEKISDKDSTKMDTIPFFICPKIDLSVEWRSLLKGSIVGELHVQDPQLNFVKGKHENEDVKADTSDFRQLIKDLMPLTVNHFEVDNGQIHYIDPFSNPQIDIALKDVDVSATNLSNVNDSSKLLPAHLDAEGYSYNGSFKLSLDLDALNKVPTFDLNAELKHINLVELNNFLRAYGNFDVKKGNFGLYTEFAARDGGFGGYVKPIIKDLDVVQWNQEEGKAPQVLWETLIGSAAELLKNQPNEQLATKIHVSGKFENPDLKLWRAVSYVLRNAFVQALKPSIDYSINIKKLEEEDKKGFFQKIVGNKKDEGKNTQKE